MPKTDMLSFYRHHSVAPVRQNLNDLDAHFARRRVLYQQLGIISDDFTNRDVLEIGPGTGQNALFIAAQAPKRFVLVEPNLRGVEEITANFSLHPEFAIPSIQNVSIEKYQEPHKFDYVLCEGLVGASGVADPAFLMRSISEHVAPKGTLVLTCIEYVAYLSEMLRRLIGVEIAGNYSDITEKTSKLVAVFSNHLQSLPGMSRRFDDWVVDNLINPASISDLVTFEACINELGDAFDVLSTSPRFIADWTWYKKAALDSDFFNRSALESYWQNLHNFMDYRSVAAPRPESFNRSLAARCEEIHHQICEFEHTGNALIRDQIIQNLRELQQLIALYIPGVSEALLEVIEWMTGCSINEDLVANSNKFGTWFGRAQTYLRLIRSR